MNAAMLAQYRRHRAEGARAKDALLMARHHARTVALDWHDVPSPPPLGWDHWDSIGWDGPHGMTVRVDVSNDDFEHCDATLADGWPIAERAAWYRREGMARGPAWQHAWETWQRDREREDEWRSCVVRVVVTLPNGAEGIDVLGGVDYLETMSYTELWHMVVDVVLGERMVDEAVRDAVANALPPQYRRSA